MQNLPSQVWLRNEQIVKRGPLYRFRRFKSTHQQIPYEALHESATESDVHGTMFRKMSKFAALGTFDFVTADGLFVSHHNEKAAFFLETNELETPFSPDKF